MIVTQKGAGGLRAALGVVGAMGAVALGCLDRPVAAVVPVIQSGISEVVRNDAVEKVDLLMVVDNSGSMAENQRNITAQLGPLINQLTNPPCISRRTPGGGTPHTCMAGNPDDVPQYPAVKDLHVGVISTDLGTPGSMVPGCDDSERGDHGLLVREEAIERAQRSSVAAREFGRRQRRESALFDQLLRRREDLFGAQGTPLSPRRLRLLRRRLRRRLRRSLLLRLCLRLRHRAAF